MMRRPDSAIHPRRPS